MNIQFRHRCLSMMLVLVMLFSMMPTSVIAEELHDHEHEVTDTIVTADEAVQLITVETLKLNASASANHVYVGDGAVTVTAGISGGVAPYDVTLQAVKNGDVAATQKVTAQDGSAKLAFTPAAYGDYELVVTARDAAGSQELVSISLAVAEHDTESEADWTASVSGASVTSNWGRSLVSVAKTQIGYTESEKDFILKNGAKQGYSRYGAWFGTPYASWNTAFLAFVAEYAKIPGDALLSGSSYRSWVNGMSAKGAFHKADEAYAPQAGDIAFLSGSRVGVIESVKGTDVTVIEGDVNGEVVRKTYAISKLAGIGNTGLLQGLHNGTATAVPTGAPEATKAPADVTAAPATTAPTAAPTATPVPNAGGELTFKATPTPGPDVTVAPKDDVNILDSIVSDVNEVVTELDAAATAVPMQFSEAYYLMQEEMRKLTAKYLGEGDKTPAEIQAFVDELELGDLYYINVETDELFKYADNIGITDYEARALYETEIDAVDFISCVAIRLNLLTAVRGTDTFTMADGKVSVTWVGTTNAEGTTKGAKNSETQATFVAYTGRSSYDTNTVTITNISGSTASIAFTATESGTGSITYDSKLSGSGSNSVTLANNGFVTITVTGKAQWFASDKQLVISNLTVTESESTYNVTLADYATELGTVTADGAEFTAGSKIQTDGVQLVATPVSGATFLGWIDENGYVYYSNATYPLAPEADMTVKPVFAKDGGTPWFGVGSTSSHTTKVDDSAGLSGVVASAVATTFSYEKVNITHIFDDLNKATAYAVNNSEKHIVLMNSGSLAAQEYTIPAGVTLLIPFDAENTLYTTSPVTVKDHSTPKEYRTLTMPEGAKLIVNGALSLSAQNKYANGGATAGSAPSGNVSYIRMAGGSNITVNSGGVLYAYGFVTGSGTVTVGSGGVVYEFFQVADFRGGSQTTDMQNRVFPMQQYYVQNVEVPMTLYAGATEYGYTTLYMGDVAIGEDVAFIGKTSSMFSLDSGYVTKKYDGSTDRLVFTAKGDISINPIELSVGNSMLGFDIDTTDYVLPLNNNLTINVVGGNISINQDVALTPGTIIKIGADATCTVSTYSTTDNGSVPAKLYAYSSDSWGAYCGSGNQQLIPVAFAPSRTYNRTTADLVDAQIEVAGTIIAVDGYLYETGNGANITGVEGAKINLSIGTETSTWMMTQGANDAADTYHEIPIRAPQLKNMAGAPEGYEYCDTAANQAGLYVYYEGYWHKQDSLDLNAEPKHTDTGENPSCTEPVLCMYCPHVMYPATEHTLTKVDAKAATCTDFGWAAYEYCQVCAYTTYAQIEATGHTPGAAATCTTAQVCTACGMEIAPALGHTVVTDAAVAPTCTTDGKTEGSHCSVCGEVLVAQEVIDKLGHNYEGYVAATCTEGAYQRCTRCDSKMYDPDNPVKPHTPAAAVQENVVDAKCEEEGSYDSVVYCSVCNTELSRTAETIPATGHSHTPAVTAPTCTEKGYTTYTCTCGDTYTDNEVDALGHTVVTDAAVAPTCTDTGKTEGKHCSVCNKVLVAQEVINALGHTPGAAATCTTAQTCTVCGAEIVAALGHKSTPLPAVDPTCTETGLTVGNKCSVCNETIVAQEEVPALGHTKADAVKENEVAAECEKEGSYDSVVYCSVCDTELSRETVTVPALGHTEVVDAAVAAKCTETGLTEGSHCSVCNEVLVAQKEIPATGHTAATAVQENVKNATCTNGGSYESVVRCSVCKVELSRTTVTTDPSGHNYTSVVTAPTCTTDGYTTYTCGKCGDTYTGDEVDALGHTEADAVKENHNNPTCAAEGSYESVVYCSVCNAELVRNKITIDKLPHTEADAVEENHNNPTCAAEGSYDSVVYCSVCNAKLSCNKITIDKLAHTEVVDAAVAPTCTDTGKTEGSHCSVCGETLVAQKVIDALGHTEVVDKAVAPTCTDPGKTEGKHCSVCKEVLVAQNVVDMRGHAYESVVTAPTCTEKGYTTHTCSRCENTYTDTYTNATGHKYESVVTAPTCTTGGYTTNTCSVCKDSYTDDQVSATGHIEADPVKENEVAATCSEKGSYDSVVYCSVESCKAELSRETKIIDALPHTDGGVVVENNKDANCTVNGSYDKVTYCTVCNVETSRETVTITAPGHTTVVDNAVAPTCTTTGLTEGSHCSVCNATIKAQEEVPALGHKNGAPVKENEVAATCTVNGSYDNVTYCTVCKVETNRDTVTVTASGHSVIEYEAKEATCTEIGWNAYEKCSVCNYTTYEEISATGHTLTPVGAKEETCTEIGWNAYEKCSKCDHTTYQEIPATGHSYSGKVTTNPTCTITGEETFTCANCGDTYTKTVSAKGHSMVSQGEVKPTCENPGSAAHSECSVCGYYEENHVIPALGHTYEREGDESAEGKVTTAPTCTDAGIRTFTCTDCGKEYTKAIDALGHTPGAAATCTTPQVCTVCNTVLYAALQHIAGEAKVENNVVPTCTVAGSYDTVVRCTRCNEVLSSERTAIDAKGHTAGAAGVENNVAPSCEMETDGSYDTVTSCSVCSEEISRETITVTWAHTPNVEEATCTQQKFCLTCSKTLETMAHMPDRETATCTEAKKCTECGTELEEAKGHTPAAAKKENEVAATCTAAGSYDSVVYCSVEGCGAEISRKTITVEKLDHKGGAPAVENTVAATCSTEGSYESVVYCSDCKEELSRETKTIAKLAHTPGEGVEENKEPATCTKNGSYDLVVYCTVCNAQISRTAKTIVATGHEYTSAVTAPTCTEQGYTTYTCSGCDDSYTDNYVNATGHKSEPAVEEKRTEATCTVAGQYESVVYCSVCETELSRETVKLELAAHTAAEAVEENRVESTCTAEGSYDMVVYCSECNAEIDRDTTTIKKKDHTPGTAVVENEKAATCTATGSYDTVVYCSECKTYEFSRVTTTIDMLDHTPGAVVMENVVKADCDKETNGSYDSVVYCTVCKNKLSSKTVVVPYEHKPGTAATCTQPQICTVCGNTLADILPHTPDREEATCTEAKTCTECEKVLQKATGHKPAAAVKEKEVVATCTTAGSYESVVYCSTCNEEQSRETVTVDKLEHEGGEPVVENTVAATCSKEGSYESVVYCSDCKTELSREPKVIEKLAHTPGEGVEENMVAATCTVDGSYELVVYCTVCNEEQSRTSVKISADGHKSEPAVEENRTESTCTVAGQYESVVYCSVCETELSRETVKLELAAHTAAEAVEENRVESTCTAEGSYDVVVYCSACKNELSREAFKIAADGHKAGTPVEENRTEASCYTNGKYDEVVYCTVCDAEMTRKTVTIQAPNKHAYGSPVVTKPATCTAEGSQQSTCTRCGSIKNETVAMVAHQYVAAVTEPTCVAEGYTTYTCSECGYNYTADTKEALGHTPSTAVMENEKASTCTAEGSYDMVVYCSVCGSEVERKTFEIEMKPHTEGEAKTEREVAATCTVDGSYDTVVYCSVCNTELNRTTITVKAEGHKYESVVTAPTCTAMGYTTYTCSVCGDTYTGDETEMLSHAYETVVTAPTCTEAGFTTYICSVCGETYTDDEVAKLGHKYEYVVTAPTCTATGYTTYTCSVCGDTYTGDETGMLSHAYETVVTDPTCTEAGFTTYTCSVCGKTYTDDEVAKLGHKYDAMVTEPTCTTEGFTTHTCSVCGHTYTDNKTPPTGHSYKPTVTAPTCTEGGYTTYTCSKCGTSQVRDQVPPAGHNPVVDTYKAPTCENTGLTEGSHCSVCNETLTAQEPIDALEHNYEASVTLEPTCTEAGVRTFVCENDATHTYTESIDALGHDEVEHEAQVVTCTAIGWDAYVTCNRCDYTTYVEIAALGHDMDEGVEDPKHTCTTAGKLTRTCKNGCGLTEVTDVLAQHTPEIIPADEPTCTETGLTAGEKCSVCGEITKEQQIVAASHTWETVTVITAATCTTQGKEAVRCVKCDATDTIVTPALGHTEVIDAAVAKTCTTDGLTEGSHCSVCNETLVAQEVVPASHEWSVAPCMYISAKCNDCGKTNEAVLDHAWSEATCSAPATCAYCNRTRGSTLPHTEEIDDEIPATCTTTGLTVGKHCSVCGYTISEQGIIPAFEHKLKDGVTSAIVQYAAKNPTFTTPGWEAYEACSRCNYTTYEEIPALGEQSIDTFQELLDYLPYIEEWAVEYARKTPGTDPVALVIKYIRTGVDRYNSGSWGIMAGYEDKGFAEYVAQKEDAYNSVYTKDEFDKMIQVTGLKNLKLFVLPNDPDFMVDFGHMFGTMDITYTNKGSENHADVGGWAGDLVDLLSTADHDSHQDLIESAGDDFEELVTVIRTKLLGYDFDHDDTFALNDYYGDLDAFYIMETMDTENYVAGDMTELFKDYFSPSLNDVARAEFLLVNRFNDVRTRSAIREAVYTEYATNAMISTLEGTREFNNTDDLITRRKAVCYAFADYLCMLAGDWVNDTDNPYLTDYESSYSLLAPGISMEIHKATSADNKNMVYYLGYADLARADVDVMAIYHDRYVEPGDWGMSRVLDQANAAAEQYHANPESEHYIENFSPVIAINGAGFNMGTGEPSGLLVMHGEEIHAPNSNGFFGITKSGKAVIGTTAEYNSTYKGELAEGIAGFGTMLVANGELWHSLPTTSYYSDRASRTAVGITATGRVVFMVLDGRQEPWSCGGSMIEIAQIMKLAGCVTAINLDGGGSTTFVARQAGDEELSLVNRPSDGVQRSVSTSLMMYSTAPSSKTFDNALIEANYNFMTVGAEVSVTATGLSATNNIVALPEGATWAVSDPEMAEIVDTGDVVINANDPTVKKSAKVVAKKLGEFEVYLMLDGVIIGQKTLGVIVPDQLYFTRDKIDGIYGQGVELPLKARYEGKEAAFVAEDIAFTIGTPDVGAMEDLTFNVVEASDAKTVTVTAALAQNEVVTASIVVVLYKEGENNFNFDAATGGNRELAWLREVANAKEEGTSTYYIIDPDEKMVTTYTIGLDMSQIPIPEKLKDLTYMLPGSDLEGASAWTFLLQLAERMSELTTVSAEFKIDPNFTVVGYDAETGEFDASGITVINEYFLLDATNGILYDPQESTLTLNLHWDGQISEAINPVEANPMCIVNGLKLVPKEDATWDDKDRLVAVNTAEVSYKVYMRANALHTFATKPENQEQFGLYPYGPYTNSRGVVENGGWFASTYATFKDTYTLVKSLKNGWVVEEGGFRYYMNGQYLTGIHFVEGDTDATGLYYQFDENGINIGQTPYTGKHVMDGKHYYMQNGKPYKGWITLDDGNWYLFDWRTGAGIHGSYTEPFTHELADGTKFTNNVVYEFENGRLLDGVWHQDHIGWRYYYGPWYYKQGWRELTTQEGQKNGTGEKAMFFFEEYYVQKNVSPVQEAHAIYEYWYEFTPEGALVRNAPSGLYWWDDDWYKGENGTKEPELYYVDENHPEGNGYSLAVKDGLYYIDGYYYFFDLWTGMAKRNTTYWIHKENAHGLPMSENFYRFDNEGRIIIFTGVVKESDGNLYYYRDGARCWSAGLISFDGHIYGVDRNAQCYVNTAVEITRTNGLVSEMGVYRFDEYGHLIQDERIANEDGSLYYYNEEGKRDVDVGLVKYAGDIYYIGLYTITGVDYNKNTAIAAAGVEIDIPQNKTNDLLAAGTYRFDENGKAILTTELVEGDDGKLYYYVNGALQKGAGMIKYNDAYYYIDANGAAVTNTEVLIEKPIAPFPVDTYEFDENGKMIIREGIYEGYYYVGGIKTAAGLVEEEGKYYFAAESGKIVADVKYDVQKTNNLVPAGIYRIGADGVLNMETGLADEDGTLFYYKNGMLAVNEGLIQIDGDYYCIDENGIALVNAKKRVTDTKDYQLTAGTYRFGADGKAILTTDLVKEEDGKLYYYKNGRMADRPELIEYEGDYYWVEVNGFVLTSQKISLSAGQKLPTGVYRIGEDGKIILTTALVNENGNLTYYKNGILTKNAGLIKLDDAYYYINDSGYAVVNGKYDVIKHNNFKPAGIYRFNKSGKMIETTELAKDADGKYYYYVEGKLTKDVGLIKYGDAYYYITEDGTAVTSAEVLVEKTIEPFPVDTYEFDAEGKMIIYEGIRNGYYYVAGVKTAAGLVQVDGAYYYAGEGGKLAASEKVNVIDTKDYEKSEGVYRFDESGKMIETTEVAKESDGKYYYYFEGKLGKDAGLVKVGAFYYYITADGTAVTDSEIEVSEGQLPAGIYRFDEEGKADLTTELVKDDDGRYYYYVNGALAKNAGLIEYNGAYYYIDEGGIAVTSTKLLVEKTNDLFPVDTYEFGADGKMVIYEGIVNGYYYVAGVKTEAGLVEIDGDYYYAAEGGKIVTSAMYEITKTNDLLAAGTYEFDTDGKIVMNDGLVEQDGKLNYYESGKLGKDAGLVKVGEDYYYIDAEGAAATDAKVEVPANELGIDAGTYRFGVDGKMNQTTEIAKEDDKYVYYENGKLGKDAGLVKVGEDYYYIGVEGAVATDEKVDVVADKTNGLDFEPGIYRFNEDGTANMATEIATEDGKLIYYKNGRLAKGAGLVQVEDDYYYIDEEGAAVTDTKMDVEDTNNLLPEGNYEFGEDGKIVMKNGLIEENGKLYYYEDGRLAEDEGLIKIEEDYYYIDVDGAAVTETRMDVVKEKTNDLLPEGNYCFGEDGKMFERLAGDADNDNDVDLDDAMLIFNYIAGEAVKINKLNADANADGEVNVHDALLILQQQAGWDVELK